MNDGVMAQFRLWFDHDDPGAHVYEVFLLGMPAVGDLYGDSQVLDEFQGWLGAEIFHELQLCSDKRYVVVGRVQIRWSPPTYPDGDWYTVFDLHEHEVREVADEEWNQRFDGENRLLELEG